jgi:CrcB protein
MILLVLPLAAGGGILRWLLAERWNARIPIGTLTANITAAFAVGLFSDLGGNFELALRVGLFGALSTWSTLAFEVADLARARDGRLAVVYLTTTVSLGISAALVGLHWSL